jgi:hypothetical protein
MLLYLLERKVWLIVKSFFDDDEDRQQQQNRFVENVQIHHVKAFVGMFSDVFLLGMIFYTLVDSNVSNIENNIVHSVTYCQQLLNYYYYC